MRRMLSLAVLPVRISFGVGIASANTAPLAEAGLDQQVERGTTVYIDAAGSTDPDGTITGYEWHITTPDGTMLKPDCPTCNLTQFVPNQTGEYNVTVTDDDGATSQDTMYVTVEAPRPPSLDLTGPRAIPAGVSRSYRAEATAGDARLSSVGWRINGTTRARDPMSGESATIHKSFSFAPGTHDITVTVIDDDGQRATDNLTVRAVPTTGTEAVGIDESTDGNNASGGGNPEELITFDAETKTWDVDTELASRMDAAVEIRGTEVTTETLENIDSSEEVVQTFTSKGDITEADMVKSAAQRKNNYEGSGEGSLDTVDNSRGQVRWTGMLPSNEGRASCGTVTGRSVGGSNTGSGSNRSGGSNGFGDGGDPDSGGYSTGGTHGGSGGAGGIGVAVP